MENVLSKQPPDVKVLIRRYNLPFTVEGAHKNILRFSTVAAFSEAGGILIAHGYELLSHRRFSLKHQKSKQRVWQLVNRDGELTEIYYDDGAKVAFVVDSV